MGHDRTGIKEWKWKHFWFVGINALLSSVPNGGITTFATIINTNAGFNVLSSSYFMAMPCMVALFLAWTLIQSNVAGHTKRTLTSPFAFIGYCLGSMVEPQFFKGQRRDTLHHIAHRCKSNEDPTKRSTTYISDHTCNRQPRYITGTVSYAVCFALQFLTLGGLACHARAAQQAA
ncbi:hypothetical protein DL765_006807 [Monosporascus sp. GIB2]|nr:hypothetical protein DL765_006807 [Monosporascus sp. GIB2]